MGRGEALLPDERYRLAQLYEQAGQWLKAQALLRVLVEYDPHNPAYLARYVRNLVQHGTLDEVGTLVARLERLEPDSVRTRKVKEIAQNASKH
jgi:hypothetical protein